MCQFTTLLTEHFDLNNFRALITWKTDLAPYAIDIHKSVHYICNEILENTTNNKFKQDGAFKLSSYKSATLNFFSRCCYSIIL